MLGAQDQNPNSPDLAYFETLILKVPAWVKKKINNLLNCFPKHNALEKQKVGSRWINMSYIWPYSYLWYSLFILLWHYKGALKLV